MYQCNAILLSTYTDVTFIGHKFKVTKAQKATGDTLQLLAATLKDQKLLSSSETTWVLKRVHSFDNVWREVKTRFKHILWTIKLNFMNVWKHFIH